MIDPTTLSNLLLAGSSQADMEAILTDTMSGGTTTKFHRALEAILETREGPDLEKLKEAVDVVCTTLKPHIANMIQREVCWQALHAAPLLCGEFGLTKVKLAKMQVTAAMSSLLRSFEDALVVATTHTHTHTTHTLLVSCRIPIHTQTHMDHDEVDRLVESSCRCCFWWISQLYTVCDCCYCPT